MVTENKSNRHVGVKTKVIGDIQRQKRQKRSFGIIQLPEDVPLYREEPNSRVKLDILQYEVTTEIHPDRNDEKQTAQKGDLWYKFPYRKHVVKVGSQTKQFVCLTTFGKSCPICDYRDKRAKEGAGRDELSELRYKRRVLYAIIPVQHRGEDGKLKEYEQKPHIWDISFHNFQRQLREELEEDEERGVFPDLQNGYRLRIRFTSDTFGDNSKPYAKASRIDFIERDAYDESILKKVPILDQILETKEYDQIFAEFSGEDVSHEEEAAEEVESKTEEVDKEAQTCSYGYTFGKDWDQEGECNDCEKWDECGDYHDEKYAK